MIYYQYGFQTGDKSNISKIVICCPFCSLSQLFGLIA